MNSIKNIFFGLIFVLSNQINAQYIAIINADAEALVDNLLGGSSCVSPTNIKAKGKPTSLKSDYSYAKFEKNGSNFPFSSGIILSTYPSKHFVGPYTGEDSAAYSIWEGDADITEAILGIKAQEATSLEFDFVAQQTNLLFRYLFATNEYQGNFPCKYSDGLAVLIKDVTLGTAYKNIAVLPDGKSVSSMNIRPKISYKDIYTESSCDAVNENYFGQYNTNSPMSSAINFAGQTKPLIAQTSLILGHQYKLKFIVANDQDNQKQSALFLEAGSFSSLVNLGENRLLSTNNSLCFGEKLPLLQSLSAPPKMFEWYKDDVLFLSTTNPIFTIEQAGNYKLKAYDINDCIYHGQVKVEYNPGIILNDLDFIKCKLNSEFAIFDLTTKDNIILNNNSNVSVSGYYIDNELNNKIDKPNIFVKSSDSDQIIFAKVANKNGCFQVGKIKLKTIQSSLTETNITPLKPNINNFLNYQNSIELILPKTTENYEYSIDGKNYQEKSIFTGLSKGTYKAYIRNLATCEYIIYPFVILDYPTFFTPNGDNANDTWKVEIFNEYPLAKLYIYDRFGKLLKYIDINENEWDGTFGGVPLAASDYWFKLLLNENQIVTGHFTLMR